MAHFQPQGRYSLTDLLNASAWLQRKNSDTPPTFAIGLMARDGKPKSTQDWMVPCATTEHQFAMVNIMKHLDAYPFTRDPKPNSEYCRRTGLGRN